MYCIYIFIFICICLPGIHVWSSSSSSIDPEVITKRRHTLLPDDQPTTNYQTTQRNRTTTRQHWALHTHLGRTLGTTRVSSQCGRRTEELGGRRGIWVSSVRGQGPRLRRSLCHRLSLIVKQESTFRVFCQNTNKATIQDEPVSVKITKKHFQA